MGLLCTLELCYIHSKAIARLEGKERDLREVRRKEERRHDTASPLAASSLWHWPSFYVHSSGYSVCLCWCVCKCFICHAVAGAHTSNMGYVNSWYPVPSSTLGRTCSATQMCAFLCVRWTRPCFESVQESWQFYGNVHPHRSVLPSSRLMPPSVLVTNGPAAGPHAEFSGPLHSTVCSACTRLFVFLFGASKAGYSYTAQKNFQHFFFIKAQLCNKLLLNLYELTCSCVFAKSSITFRNNRLIFNCAT